jgi:DNA-binding transcriptional regulator YiaG
MKRPWTAKGVRELRQHLGLTQGEMARELGTRQQTISEWERGVYRPRGTSCTVLSIIAERAGFEYEAGDRAG